MATAALEWNNIVGIDKTVLDSGYTGDLLQVAGAHLQSALDAGRLTQSQVGEIYATMIPSAFQQAIQFELHEQLTEAQIDKAVADAAVAAAQVDIAVAEAANAQAKTLAEIIKVYGFDATIDANGIITLGINRENGRMDAELELINEQIHDAEWARRATALKIQVDAEVDLYAAKRLDKLPSIINGDEDASVQYADLVSRIVQV
jgi:hypothetical protein